LTEPDILIVDEPTHGIDIGAKNEVYNILNTLAAEGKGILMISSELPELLSVCDRILVMKAGVITGELSRDEATEEKVLALAM
jgi:ABC-type sugar transport system ATPase subunit